MSEGSFSAAVQTSILPIPVPETTVTQAARDTGIPSRTIRALCSDYGAPLARRDGRVWMVDADLLREVAKQRREGPAASAPTPAKPVPDYYRLTPDEAAGVLDIDSQTIRRWCVGIPRLAMRVKGDRGEWRIEPTLLGIIAFHWCTKIGTLPEGALIRRSPQQRRLLGNLLKLLARIERGEGGILPAYYLTAVERRIAQRPKRTPPAATVQPGEVRDAQR